jgi:hypothetical protein
MQADGQCPYQVGDTVRYTPSAKGLALSVMDAPEETLVVGNTYTIESIVRGRYVVVAGYQHPGGGLFWTEFTKCNDS